MTYEEIGLKYDVIVSRIYLHGDVGYCGLSIKSTIPRSLDIKDVQIEKINKGRGYINVSHGTLGSFALIELSEGELLIASEPLSNYPIEMFSSDLIRFEKYLQSFVDWRNILQKMFLPINSIHFVKEMLK